MRADMRTDMRGGARGFTLIEILMAMMILSIGLASVLSVFVVGLRSSRRVVDESAAAVAAKAMLARVLSEDVLPKNVGAPDGDGVRDYLELIALARGPGDPQCDWVWIHNQNNVTSGTVGTVPADDAIPAPVSIATDSRFSWRCRASRHRGVPGQPRVDFEDPNSPGSYILLGDGRIPDSQATNPDSDEMWRLTLEIYRDWQVGMKPLNTFETYICMAHR